MDIITCLRSELCLTFGYYKTCWRLSKHFLHCSLYLFYRMTFNSWLILLKFQLLLRVTYRKNVVLSSFDMFVHEQDLIAMLQEEIFSAYQFQKTVCRSIYSARVLWTAFMVLYWHFWRSWRSAFTAAWINQMKPCKILQNTCVFHGRKQAFH